MRLLASPLDGRAVRVSISRAVPDDCLGDCTQRKGHYLIRIHKDVAERCPEAIYLILAHEWAHVIAWESSRADHDECWGIALAEADEGKSCATDSERCGACCSAYVCPDGKRANRYCPQCRTQPSWNNPSLAERREERQQEDDYWGRRRRLY